MNKILVIGASGHAKVIIEAIELNQKYEIYGLIDSYKPKGQKILGYEILGTENLLPKIVVEKGIKKGVIAIGDNWQRAQLYKRIIKQVPDFEFISVIHPSAVVSKYITIGIGTVILASVTINTDAKIGDFCILNTDANFGHDCKMKDFSSLAPNVSVGGNTTIGKFSAVSTSATIIHNINIGKQVLIGAGAVVVKDISNYTVAYGVPARTIRKREIGEEYLKSSTPKVNYGFNAFPILTIQDQEKYKNMIQKYQGNNVYFSIEHMKYFEQESDQLTYFVLEKEGHPIILMPMIIRKISSDSPYLDAVSPYGYQGPLINKSAKEADVKKFWDFLDNWYFENNIISEFIRFSLDNNYVNYSGTIKKTLANVTGVLLTSFDEQWNGFVSKVRNNFRKAVNHNLTFKIFHKDQIDNTIIKVFNDIYVATMHRNNADSLYFFSEGYFKDLILSNSESFSIAIAYFEETPISVELIINDQKTLFAFLGGTNADYFSYRPNDFLRVKIIEWAIENKFERYVLGGGLKNGDGLYKSKKALFPKNEDIVFCTGRKIINHTVYNKLSQSNYPEYGNLSEEELSSLYFPLYRRKDE